MNHDFLDSVIKFRFILEEMITLLIIYFYIIVNISAHHDATLEIPRQYQSATINPTLSLKFTNSVMASFN